MENKSLMELELEKRKSRVGGYDRLKSFASRAGSQLSVVAGRVKDGVKTASVRIADAKTSYDANRLKSLKSQNALASERLKLAKSKASLERVTGSSGGPLSSLGGRSPFSLNQPAEDVPKKKDEGTIRIIIKK